MGNCAASKLEKEGDVVAVCRERKRLLKAALERRYHLAEAHTKYMQSLYKVSAAIDLFVACHTLPHSPYVITLPPSPPKRPPSEQQQPPPPPLTTATTTSPAVCAHSPSSPSSLSSASEQEEESQAQLEPPEYIYSGMGPPVPSPAREFGWDFFNPFEGERGADVEMMRTMGGLSRSSEEDLRVVREEEGIPELEDEEEDEGDEEEVEEQEKKVDVVKEESGGGREDAKEWEKKQETRGLSVLQTSAGERDLMEALKAVQDHFIRAYDSGHDVSRMLEANRVLLHSGFDEIKENSTKFIQAITWHRSTSYQSSSQKSFASSSKDSTWTEYKNELFEDFDGMESGSHSLTLGRLYAWEKKLYQEVKEGDRTHKIYKRKCSQLRNQDDKGDEMQNVDKTRVAVRDLYTKIWVALRTAESISNRIQKLRDEELQPQLVELLRGLMKSWKVMLESHQTQTQMMFEVKSSASSSYGRFCGDSHRRATHQLETEFQNWRACFMDYVAAQRAYVEALDGWLSKFIIPEVETYSGETSSILPYRDSAPSLVVICHDWHNSLGKLPDKAVAYAMKSFIKSVAALRVQQGEEQQQRRKVDSLAKELDRRVLAFQKLENRILECKLSESKTEPDVGQQVEYLSGRKDLVDMLRSRLDMEKAKDHNCIEETQRVMLNGFQAGLKSLFESLEDFSKASLDMYDELVMYREKAEVADEMGGKPSWIEGSQYEVDNRSICE